MLEFLKILLVVSLAMLDSTLGVFPAYASLAEVKRESMMQKIAHYRKAIWLTEDNEQQDTVEAIISNALNGMPEVSNTKFEYKSGVDVQVSTRSITEDQGIGLYMTLYSEGKPTGVVENGGSMIGKASAPNGQEFLKTGLHMIINGNHLAYIANGHTNDGQINGLIHKFISHAGFNAEQTKFVFMPRANRAEIQRLLGDGVKSLEIGMTDFVTAMNQMNQAENVGQLPALIRTFNRIFGRDRRHEEARAAGEIQAKILLDYDGRGANALTPSVMSDIASQIVDGYEDQFRIITKNKDVITHEKLIIKRTINVDGDDIAIDPDSAFVGLRHAISEWRNSGVLNG